MKDDMILKNQKAENLEGKYKVMSLDAFPCKSIIDLYFKILKK